MSTSESRARCRACGATLHPDREFTSVVAKTLIPNWTKLNDKQKQAVERAHTRDHIRNLFRPPEKYNKQFDWPYYIDTQQGNVFSDTKMEHEYYKMLKTTPGKARHDGFTLNLVGRLPIKWQTTELEIHELSITLQRTHHPYNL